MWDPSPSPFPSRNSVSQNRVIYRVRKIQQWSLINKIKHNPLYTSTHIHIHRQYNNCSWYWNPVLYPETHLFKRIYTANNKHIQKWRCGGNNATAHGLGVLTRTQGSLQIHDHRMILLLWGRSSSIELKAKLHKRNK